MGSLKEVLAWAGVLSFPCIAYIFFFWVVPLNMVSNPFRICWARGLKAVLAVHLVVLGMSGLCAWILWSVNFLSVDTTTGM